MCGKKNPGDQGFCRKLAVYDRPELHHGQAHANQLLSVLSANLGIHHPGLSPPLIDMIIDKMQISAQDDLILVYAAGLNLDLNSRDLWSWTMISEPQ